MIIWKVGICRKNTTKSKSPMKSVTTSRKKTETKVATKPAKQAKTSNVKQHKIINSGKLGLNDLDIAEALRDDLEYAVSLFK